jgi:hypothetical protein
MAKYQYSTSLNKYPLEFYAMKSRKASVKMNKNRTEIASYLVNEHKSSKEAE